MEKFSILKGRIRIKVWY